MTSHKWQEMFWKSQSGRRDGTRKCKRKYNRKCNRSFYPSLQQQNLRPHKLTFPGIPPQPQPRQCLLRDGLGDMRGLQSRQWRSSRLGHQLRSSNISTNDTRMCSNITFCSGWGNKASMDWLCSSLLEKKALFCPLDYPLGLRHS